MLQATQRIHQPIRGARFGADEPMYAGGVWQAAGRGTHSPKRTHALLLKAGNLVAA